MIDELATTARSIVATSHVGRVLRGGYPPEPVTYVDDAGEPLVLLPRCGPLPTAGSSVRGVLVVSRADGALTVLAGRLHCVGAADEAARTALRQHVRCIAPSSQSVQAARLAVHEVVLFVDGTSHAVSELAYASALPDTFAAQAPDVADHLGRAHPELLRGCVSGLIEGEVVATEVRTLAPDRMELDVVTDVGASVVTLRLHPPVTSAHDVCDRLLELSLGLA